MNSMYDAQAVDVAMLVLRVGLGLAISAHAVQKLFGWFGGGGLTGTASIFDRLGFRPGTLNALLAGTTELLGSILLMLGLLTPVACALLIGTMIVASSTRFSSGFFALTGGHEVSTAYAFAAAVLALAGPGRLSLDQLIGHPIAGLWAGIGAIVVGVVFAVPMITRARVLLRTVSP